MSYYSDFGSPLLGILTRPHVMLRPFVIKRYRARPWVTILSLGGCVRRSRARFRSHRSSQAHDCVATSVHFHVGSSPVSRPSTRSPQRPGTRVFQAGSLRRRDAHVYVRSPSASYLPSTPQREVDGRERLSLKEEGPPAVASLAPTCRNLCY